MVGIQNYVCDNFGPGVHLAARMEAMPEPMRITPSAAAYNLIQEEFVFEERGHHDIKGFGTMELFFLEGEKERTTTRL